MSVTLTHTRKRLGRCGGRAGYRARAPRRIRKGNRDEKKRSKNESRRPSFRVPTRDAFDGSPQHDNYYFTPEGGDLYPADLSTRPRDHTRGCKSTGDPGARRAALFFSPRATTLSTLAILSRMPTARQKASSATRTHAHTCTGRRGRASSTARSFNFRRAETPRAFGRSSPSRIDGYR